MAIVYSQDDYGSFEWNVASNTTWHKVSLKPQIQSKGSTLQMVLLKPYDKIRFILNGSKTEWTADDALSKASIKFHTWDIADNRTSGLNAISLGIDELECDRYPLSLCCYTQYLIQIPIGGCDQKPGSTLKNNTCGQCTLVENQIYKLCNDCNAVIGNNLNFHFSLSLAVKLSCNQ